MGRVSSSTVTELVVLAVLIACSPEARGERRIAFDTDECQGRPLARAVAVDSGPFRQSIEWDCSHAGRTLRAAAEQSSTVEPRQMAGLLAARVSAGGTQPTSARAVASFDEPFELPVASIVTVSAHASGQSGPGAFVHLGLGRAGRSLCRLGASVVRNGTARCRRLLTPGRYRLTVMTVASIEVPDDVHRFASARVRFDLRVSSSSRVNP